jgi:uncharacterized membrane protein
MKIKDFENKQLASLGFFLVCILALGYLLIFTERSNLWIAAGLFTMQAAILVYLNVYDARNTPNSPGR